MVDAINDQNFDEETSNGVALVDFWATWCGPCKMQSPVIEQLSEERQDVTSTRWMLIKTKILLRTWHYGYPNLIIKKDGNIVDRITGYTPKEKLDQILDQ